MPTETPAPVSVAVINDYELIVRGVKAMLQQYPELVEVREALVLGQSIKPPAVDVALYDIYGRVDIATADLEDMVSSVHVGHVALFSNHLNAAMIDEARRCGVTGFISKYLPGEEIARAIVEVASGSEVFAPASGSTGAKEELDWPGKDDGLTERESQVLILMAQGLSNPEIARSLYLSLETIKTHTSKIFRKLGVRNRIQASGYAERSGAFHLYQPAGPGIDQPRGDQGSH